MVEVSVDILHSLESTYRQHVRCVSELKEVLAVVLARPPHYSTLRVNTLQYDVVQVKSRLQAHLLHHYPHHHFTVLQHPRLPDLLLIPSIPTPTQAAGGAVQVQSDGEVIVDVACGAAVLRGAPVYGAGVLAASAHMQAGHLVSLYADVEGKCLRGYSKPYPGSKFFLGRGVSHMSRHHIFTTPPAHLKGVAVEVTQPLLAAPALNGVLAGEVFAQNLPSVVCGHVLGPQPGEVVLDMCAAPGGKTGHLASLMANTGLLVALDRSERKVAQVEGVCSTLGLTCVQCYAYDGTRLVCDMQGSRPAVGKPTPPPYQAESFHRVLVDAPCSALGRRPQLANHMISSQLRSYPMLQQKLLSSAVKVLKVGGVLVYSTCTLTLAENEAQVHWLLTEYGDMLRLVPQRPHVLAGGGLDGAMLTPEERALVQRFDPVLKQLTSTNNPASTATNTHKYDDDTIGFFIAKFIKLRPSLEN